MFGNIISKWVRRATNRFEREIEDAAQSIGLWILSGLFMAMAIGFATFLAYDELAAIYGPKWTLTGLGIFFALASAFSAFWASGKIKLDVNSDKVREDEAKPDDAPKEEPLGELASSMDDLAEFLGNAGMRKEALGLMAAKGALGDVKPLQLVALALVAGFIVGRGR